MAEMSLNITENFLLSGSKLSFNAKSNMEVHLEQTVYIDKHLEDLVEPYILSSASLCTRSVSYVTWKWILAIPSYSSFVTSLTSSTNNATRTLSSISNKTENLCFAHFAALQ